MRIEIKLYPENKTTALDFKVESATVMELEFAAMKTAMVPNAQNGRNLITKLKKAAGGLIIARVSKVVGISREFITSLYNHLWKSATSSGETANGN